MLSRKIPKLKLWSRLGLRSKGGSNTGHIIATASFCKTFSIRSRDFGKYVLQGIPVLSIFALVGIGSYAIGVVGFDMATGNQIVYAAEGGSSGASASLTIDNGNIIDNISAATGETAYASHNIKISASDIDGYAVTISGPVNLSGATTITGAGGKTGASMANNTWGYAWGADNAVESSMSYQSFTGSAKTIESATAANNTANVSRKLAFAARFGGNAVDGHYRATVGLSLTVTPKKVSSLTGMTTMQDMYTNNSNGVSDICAASVVGDTKAGVTDIRDGSTYSIRKHEDNNCWMTQNLRIVDKTISAADSDITSANASVPVSDISKFTTAYNTNSAYYGNDATYGAYYSWYTATAGTGLQSVASGNVSDSICPKGWKLPTKNDYLVLTTAIGAENSTNGSALLRNSVYKFQYAGSVSSGSLSNTVGSQGRVWSRSASSGTAAYVLGFDSTTANPADSRTKYFGYSVRCVAYSKDTKISVIGFDSNQYYYQEGLPSALPCVADANSSSCTVALPTNVPTARCGFVFLGWSTDKGATTPTYKAGDKITIASDTTLYGVWVMSARAEDPCPAPKPQ